MNASSSTSSSGLQFTHPYLAVVLGGGFTGMLAAAALSEHADVIVVERDRLPRTPALPTDLPRARHAHLLTTDGARIIESLLPGTVERWLAEGARRIPLPAGLLGMPPQRPLRRGPRTQHLIACSRDLLDRAIRERVPALYGVSVLETTEAEQLTGTAEHVTGVRVRDTVTGETYRLDADLVVDATGRHSTTPRRLTGLGLPAAHEEVVDAGVVCATRIFRAPAGAENCPPITVGSDAGGTAPGRSATLVPIEGGRWLVTLSGAGNDGPSQHAGRFVPFARGIPNSVIGDLIADAEPLSEVRLSRDSANRRRRYEQLRSWPTGFVALGGAVATFNPDYGQGLSIAAHGAAALRDALRRHGLDDPLLARGLQRSIARIIQAPWTLATSQALLSSPGTTGARFPSASKLVRDTAQRVLHSAVVRPPVCRAYVDIATPAVPVARLLRPAPDGSPDAVSSPGPAASPASSSQTSGDSAALSAVPTASAPASRRLPRRLGLGPAALRRIGGTGKRKPAG
ncbi:pyridine nucleotide-disulfide oxidoreductase [Streptomyces piniterrae]|uniref:Pyridine nucleotide-disulfide oxidoreductase n=1 Tax=Streptomyces piniterrae TaxID=2571125 RepID=A0A4U0NB11_9ACTN|nr:FAD-dependent monooxygenase [Streptomyces piniterrae]TJZ51070.1 pyridine nucleotide-disulfide oxidoreductase [Streptomyces piniterrae]